MTADHHPSLQRLGKERQGFLRRIKRLDVPIASERQANTEPEPKQYNGQPDTTKSPQTT